MYVTTQGKCSECGAQFDGCHALFSKVETLLSSQVIKLEVENKRLSERVSQLENLVEQEDASSWRLSFLETEITRLREVMEPVIDLAAMMASRLKNEGDRVEAATQVHAARRALARQKLGIIK